MSFSLPFLNRGLILAYLSLSGKTPVYFISKIEDIKDLAHSSSDSVEIASFNSIMQTLKQNEANQIPSAFYNATDSHTKLVMFSVENEGIATINFSYGIKIFCSH